MTKTKHCKGGALLTALFIMTLVAIASTAISLEISRSIYRTQLVIAGDQLQLTSQYIYYWAMSELSSKPLTPLKAGDSLLVRWPNRLNPQNSSIHITAQIHDLQGRFNLNQLVNKSARPSFSRLLQDTTNINQVKAKFLADATHAWLSPYTLDKGLTHYDEYYHAQASPYNTAHLLFSNTSEFRLVKGVTAAIYRAITPYVTSLPPDTPLNINTASPPVLATLNNGLITQAQLKRILKARGKQGFKNSTEVNRLLAELNIKENLVTLKSDYFLCLIYLTYGDLNLNEQVILKRTPDIKNKGSIHVSIESIELI